MAKFSLSACPTWRYRDHLGAGTMSQPMSRLGERQQIEARSLKEIQQGVATYGHTIAAAYPDATFSVVVLILRGSRKPNGFDTAYKTGALGTEEWVQERSHDGKPLPVAAAAEAAVSPLAA